MRAWCLTGVLAVLAFAPSHAQDSELLENVEKPYRAALETMKGVFAPDAKETDKKCREAVESLKSAQAGIHRYLARHPEKGSVLLPLREEIRAALLWVRRFSGEAPPKPDENPDGTPPEKSRTYSVEEEGENLFWLVETYEKEHLKTTSLIVRRYIDIAAQYPDTPFGRHAMRRAVDLMNKGLDELELLETGSALLRASQLAQKPASRPQLSEKRAASLAKKLDTLAAWVRSVAKLQAQKAELEDRIRYCQKRVDQITAILESQGAKMGIEQYRKYEKEQTDCMNSIPDCKRQQEESRAKVDEERRKIDKGVEEVLAMGPGAIQAVEEILRGMPKDDTARPFAENLRYQMVRQERAGAGSNASVPQSPDNNH